MKLSVFFIALLFALPSFAGSRFMGFKKGTKDKSVETKGTVVAIEENEAEFLIGLKDKPAFYLFPKNKTDTDGVRDFLSNLKTKKKTVTLEINPRNTQVYALKAE